MASKGIGVAECKDHGEYFLDAEDSPCPSCEDKNYDTTEIDKVIAKARKTLDEMEACIKAGDKDEAYWKSEHMPHVSDYKSAINEITPGWD